MSCLPFTMYNRDLVCLLFYLLWVVFKLHITCSTELNYFVHIHMPTDVYLYKYICNFASIEALVIWDVCCWIIKLVMCICYHLTQNHLFNTVFIMWHSNIYLNILFIIYLLNWFIVLNISGFRELVTVELLLSPYIHWNVSRYVSMQRLTA